MIQRQESTVLAVDSFIRNTLQSIKDGCRDAGKPLSVTLEFEPTLAGNIRDTTDTPAGKAVVVIDLRETGE